MHPIGFCRSAAKRDHYDDVAETHLFAQMPDGTTLEGERLFVAWRVVTGRPAQANHRVLFRLLELPAADEIRVFVRFEIG